MLDKQSLENTGHKKTFHIFYDKGGLSWYTQRMDVGFVEGDAEYSPKAVIRIGKSDINGGEFKNVLTKKGYEVPQEFRTFNWERVQEIAEELMNTQMRLMKESFVPREVYSYVKDRYIKHMMDVFKK